MNQKLLRIIIISVFMCAILIIYGQQSFVSLGGVGQSNVGTLDYSVGQLFFVNTDEIQHGVQQSYEISLLTGTEQYSLKCISFSIYPNPTSSFINIIIERNSDEIFCFQLVDLRGSIMFTNKIVNKTTKLDINSLHNGIYFLKIINTKSSTIKTYKIIKNET